jgi:hypothetical protein
MPISTVIELARNKSNQQYTLNSQWSNNLNETLDLPVGSVIQMKQAFIDEGAPFPDGAIEIDTDVDLSMGFVYWLTDQNKGAPTYNNILAANQGKGGLFIACKYFNAVGPTPAYIGDTIEGSLTFTLPKGIYSPDNLSQFITNKMSNLSIEVTTNNLPPYTTAQTNTLLQSTAGNVVVYNCYCPRPDALIDQIQVINITITPALQAQFSVGKQVYIAYEDTAGNWIPYQLYTVSGAMDGTGLFTFQPSLNGSKAGKNNWRCFPAVNDHNFIGFYLAGQKATDKYFTYQNQDSWYGASQASLVYQNERFQFNYLHSPHFVDGAGTVGVTIDNSNLENTIINANSGIAFTSLLPTSFWGDTLGFDLSANGMTRTIAEYENYNPPAPDTDSILQFGVNITGALVGNYSLPTQTNAQGMIVNDAAAYFSITSQTDGIVAINANSGSSAQKDPGYYYIDINGLESSKLYNELRTDLNISGVVSRYRSTNGFITAYTESASQYIVQFPMKLSSFDVRILLPDYTPALTLGEGSAVFIEVITPTIEEQQMNSEQQNKKKTTND